MSDTPRHEPKYHKQTTFQYLMEARADLRRAINEKDAAERAVQEAQAKADSFEKDAAEWMKRDGTNICTVLITRSAVVGSVVVHQHEVSRVAVFRLLSDDSIHQTITEPTR